MREPFHSPPTNVLFSWMYFQTLHNTYRFLDWTDKTAAFCRVSATQKRRPWKTKQLKRTKHLSLGNLSSSSLKQKALVWLFKSNCQTFVEGFEISWFSSVLRKERTFFIRAWQCYDFVFDFKRTLLIIWVYPLRTFQLVKWCVQQTDRSIKLFQQQEKQNIWLPAF